ncbi:hypothetical protein [Paraburkholderia tropica]|uniref:hypothetical protein n=1 Tax=Paraburkholderia tropica TaxID=92647 RepID=UPI002AB75D76|nr:hypothetical protein [Paraburkholderia tropica]
MFSLLVTGLLREPDMFLRTLSEWGETGLVSEIIISTWASEHAKFEALMANAGKPLPAIRYVINREPLFDFQTPKNVTHQLHTLINGVLGCKQEWVFKIRTDFYAAPITWPYLHRAVLQVPAGPVAEFHRKVWVPWIDYEEPFHLADEAIFGTRRDLLRIASRGLCGLSEFGFPLVNQHTLLFTPSLDITGRVFRDWLRAQQVTGIVVNDATPLKFRKLGALLTSDAYQSMLGVYHRYLSENFCPGSAEGALSFMPTGGQNGVYYADRQLELSASTRLFAQELAGFHNHFYAWSEESLSRLFAQTRNAAGFEHYACAFADPSPTVRISGEHRVDEFSEVLRRGARGAN